MHGIPVTLSTIKESVNAEYDRVKTGLAQHQQVTRGGKNTECP